MKKLFFRKILLTLAFFFILAELFMPFTVFADGTYYAKDKDDKEVEVTYKGLVPCGKGKDGLVSGESDLVAESCQLCHFFVMIDAIIDFVLGVLLTPVFLFMIAIAGIMFFFAGTSPDRLKRAKTLITSIVIGLFIIFSAYAIVGSLFKAIGLADDNPIEDWFQGNGFTFVCPINYSDTGNGIVGPSNGVGDGEGIQNYYSNHDSAEGEMAVRVEAMCSEYEKAIGGSCDPDVGYIVESEGGFITDNGNNVGYYCIFESKYNLNSPYYQAPAGRATVNCTLDINAVPDSTLLSHKKAKGVLDENNIDVELPCTDENCGGNDDFFGCTCLQGIPAGVIKELITVKEISGKYVKVTGGTEGGHETHGPGIPILDLKSTGNEGFNDWVRTYGDEITLTPGQSAYFQEAYSIDTGDSNAIFYFETDHWHVDFGA
jgi:type IV secretory pathway VirB2 component (pilin)